LLYIGDGGSSGFMGDDDPQSLFLDFVGDGFSAQEIDYSEEEVEIKLSVVD
jgi:hypothetical protein